MRLRNLRLLAGSAVVLISLVLSGLPARADGGQAGITGKVVDSRGRPVSGALVQVEHDDGGVLQNWARTGKDGTYRLGPVASGRATVEFFTTATYIGQYYNGARWRSGARRINISDYDTWTTGVNARLATAGHLTGTVRGKDGKPVPGAVVTATGSNHGVQLAHTGVIRVRADSRGRYDLGGLDTGKVDLRVADPNGNHLNGSASGIAVTAGRSTAGGDVTLRPAGHVAGRVTGAGGKPVAGAIITIDNGYRSVRTASDGRYDLGGISPGVHAVDIDATNSNYVVDECDNITVAYEHPSTCSPRLTFGGEISGRLTDVTGRKPVQTFVQIYRVGVTPTLVDPPSYSVMSDETGRYVAHGLPVGRYRVEFSPWTATSATVWYPQSIGYTDAALVAVRAGRATRGIGGRLPKGSTISGAVSLAAGGKGAPLSVTVYESATGDPLQMVDAGRGGRYEFQGLPAGSYRVGSDSSNDDVTVAPRFYPSSATLAAAGVVKVGAGGTRRGIDFTAPIGASIAGYTVDRFGRPTACEISLRYPDGTWMSRFIENDPATGYFVMRGLNVGQYRLDANCSGGAGSYDATAPGGLGTWDAGTYITTTLGQTVTLPSYLYPYSTSTTPRFSSAPRPTIEGTPSVGSVLTASAAPSVPAAKETYFSWLVDGVAVADGSTYTPTAADRGKSLRVSAERWTGTVRVLTTVSDAVTVK